MEKADQPTHAQRGRGKGGAAAAAQAQQARTPSLRRPGGEGEGEEGKKKLRTSKDVYDKLKWDAQYDTSQIVIGYEDRFRGVLEIAFDKFDPKRSDIPWHRIHYFCAEHSGRFLWDRETRMDAVFGSGEGAEPKEKPRRKVGEKLKETEPKTKKASRGRKAELRQHKKESRDRAKQERKEKEASIRFLDLPIFRFDKEWDEWRETSATNEDEERNEETRRMEELVVVTFNVLFDHYLKEKIHTARRIPVLLELLRRSEADVIGLEEVTRPFLKALLAEEWVREGYYVSEIPERGSTITPYGQVLLCRIPFHSLQMAKFSQNKGVILGCIKLNNRLVYLPVVHLTSEYHVAEHTTVSKRDALLYKRKRQLSIVFSGACPLGLDEDDGTDCVLMGDFNFGDEAKENQLIRGDFEDSWLTLHMSEAGFTFDPSVNNLAALNSQTGASRRLDRILVRSPFRRWQPTEVTLLGTEPFEIQLSKEEEENEGEEEEEEGKKQGVTTVTLFPSDHFGVRCVLKFNGTADLPGMEQAATKTKTEEEADEALAEEEEEQPTPLSKYLRAQPGLYETKAQCNRRREALEKLELVCKKMLAPFAQEEAENDREKTCYGSLFALGSYRLGVHSANSDVDVLCVGPPSALLSVETFFEQLAARLKVMQGAKVLSFAFDALVPIMRAVIYDIKLDILYCSYPSNITPGPPEQVKESQLRFFDKSSIRCLHGPRDTMVLLNSLSEQQLPIFRRVLRAVKLWAKARGLLSNSMCFLGSFSWSVMVAWACVHYPVGNLLSDQTLLDFFFATFSGWDWSKSHVSLVTTNYERESENELMTILTPSAPVKNSARNITQSTFKILRNELQRAHKCTAKLHAESEPASEGGSVFSESLSPNSWSQLFEAPDYFHMYKSYFQFDLCCLSEKDLHSSVGWMESRMVVFITEVEQLGNTLLHPFVGTFHNIYNKLEQLLLQESSTETKKEKEKETVTTNNFPYTATYFVGIYNHKTEEGEAEEQKEKERRNNMEAVTRSFSRSFEAWEGHPEGSILLIKQVAPRHDPLLKRIHALSRD
ncbi:Endonuclease [Balamuthia mandrillaris]